MVDHHIAKLSHNFGWIQIVYTHLNDVLYAHSHTQRGSKSLWNFWLVSFSFVYVKENDSLGRETIVVARDIFTEWKRIEWKSSSKTLFFWRLKRCEDIWASQQQCPEKGNHILKAVCRKSPCQKDPKDRRYWGVLCCVCLYRLWNEITWLVLWKNTVKGTQILYRRKISFFFAHHMLMALLKIFFRFETTGSGWSLSKHLQ